MRLESRTLIVGSKFNRQVAKRRAATLSKSSQVSFKASNATKHVVDRGFEHNSCSPLVLDEDLGECCCPYCEGQQDHLDKGSLSGERQPLPQEHCSPAKGKGRGTNTGWGGEGGLGVAGRSVLVTLSTV